MQANPDTHVNKLKKKAKEETSRRTRKSLKKSELEGDF
jgi:hypothetical protein